MHPLHTKISSAPIGVENAGKVKCMINHSTNRNGALQFYLRLPEIVHPSFKKNEPRACKKKKFQIQVQSKKSKKTANPFVACRPLLLMGIGPRKERIMNTDSKKRTRGALFYPRARGETT